MPRTTKALTNIEIKTAKAKTKEYKLFDGGGLYISITPKGHKWWRLKYRYDSKEKRISLGVYPIITLSVARQQREKLKKLIASGIDPSQERKEKKRKKSSNKMKLKHRIHSIMFLKNG